jgi:hypothetical protein
MVDYVAVAGEKLRYGTASKQKGKLETRNQKLEFGMGKDKTVLPDGYWKWTFSLGTLVVRSGAR